MRRIFVIEDDINITRLIEEYMSRYDYEVRTVQDYDRVSCEIGEFDPHIVLLDIGLPKYDGFFFCREIRKVSTAPILMISGRDHEKDQIRALELGADDYLTKPFTLEHLHSKVKAIIRRVYGELSSNSNKSNVDFSIKYDTMSIHFKGDEIELTKSEFKIFSMLYENMNRIVSRNELIEELWENSMFVEENTLTVNVTRIKKKLESIGISNSIRTKRGVGYILKGEDV